MEMTDKGILKTLQEMIDVCGLRDHRSLEEFRDYVDTEIISGTGEVILIIEVTHDGFLIRLNGRYTFELREQPFPSWNTEGYFFSLRDLRRLDHRGFPAEDMAGEAPNYDKAREVYHRLFEKYIG